MHTVSRGNVFVPDHLDHSLSNRVVSQALTVQPALLSHPLNHVSQFIEADPLHNKPLVIWSCQSPGPRRNVEWTSWLTISTGSHRGKQLIGCDGASVVLCGIQPRWHFPDVLNVTPCPCFGLALIQFKELRAICCRSEGNVFPA
ncbi:hypothetical protein DPMN_182939 [Dreissena polymorpha]|uniref:Uncharacterized protein n=1 Tax=Dreissena polymorpha TaxID=45954 RepID=A0A9D4I5X6_DREPO|nr:hypothetical protein DPMN_182939 [Dreissena polymorpha]